MIAANKEHTVWVEKYRPTTLDQYIGNKHIVSKVKNYFQDNDIQNMLLYGIQGSGKSTLAKIIVNHLKCDSMYINASDENGVEVIRQKVKNFAMTAGFQPLKIVILDEGDFLSPQGQAILRNLTETYSKHCRFIMTCNYIEKIIEPIQSRFQTFHVSPPTKPEIANYLAGILDSESVSYEKNDLATIINNHYPDIRKIVNTAQMHTLDGKISIDKDNEALSNYIEKVLEVLSKKHSKPEEPFQQIRKHIADSRNKSFEQLYRSVFDSIDNLVNEPDKKAQIISCVAEYQYKDSFVVDKEINVMAMIVELLQILNG